MNKLLKSRIAKLEQKRQPKRRTNSLLTYDITDPEEPEKTLRNAPKGKYMLIGTWPSDEAWEEALLEHQRKLRSA